MARNHSQNERLPNESPIRLREIEPSPVEETPPNRQNIDSYFPPPSPEPTTGSANASFRFGDHGAGFYLLRLQKYSSYAFGIFSALHLANTSAIPLLTRSVPASDNYLLLTRPFYQSRLAEPLLVAAPLAVHVAAGLALRLHRRRQALRRYGARSRAEKDRVAYPALSGTSGLGLALVPLVAAHAVATRLVPLWVEGSSANVGLEFVAHGAERHPVVVGVGQAMLVVVAVWHAVWGWGKWMGWTPGAVRPEAGEVAKKRRRRRWIGLNGAATVLAGVWLAGGVGIVLRGGKMKGWLGEVYDELYRKMPIVGAWY